MRNQNKKSTSSNEVAWPHLKAEYPSRGKISFETTDANFHGLQSASVSTTDHHRHRYSTGTKWKRTESEATTQQVAIKCIRTHVNGWTESNKAIDEQTSLFLKIPGEHRNILREFMQRRDIPGPVLQSGHSKQTSPWGSHCILPAMALTSLRSASCFSLQSALGNLYVESQAGRTVSGVPYMAHEPRAESYILWCWIGWPSYSRSRRPGWMAHNTSIWPSSSPL